MMRHFTTNCNYECHNGSSNLITPYREKPLSTTIGCCRLPTACALRFDQPAEVPQGQTPNRNQENYSTDVHGGRRFEPVKLARAGLMVGSIRALMISRQIYMTAHRRSFLSCTDLPGM